MASIHGVLINVDNVGVLIIGVPGSGKSSLALELLQAGHRLVADDVIELSDRDGKLYGSAPDRFYGAIEVRGLGILDAEKLFGEDSVIGSSPVDICIELRADFESSRTEEHLELLDRTIQRVILTAERSMNRKAFVETAVKVFRDPSIMLGDLNERLRAEQSG